MTSYYREGERCATFRGTRKILDHWLNMAAWSLVSEKYFKAIHIKELYFKQGECELEDLTHLLARNLLKAKMFVNLFKIALNPVS